MSMTRRDILAGAGIVAASALDSISSESGTSRRRRELPTKPSSGVRAFNSIYHGDYLNQIAFPLGGIGAGMFCLEGTGALTKFSLRNRPDLGNEPHAFSAICIKGSRKTARVLEGPVPAWKLRPFLPGVEGTYPV